MKKILQHPIYILLIINLVLGIFTFRSYGLSWDEPLFYDYADALPYAYSPKEWFSGNFNLENAYGSSGTDHANRGPAYILLARPVVTGFKSLGLDNASAWHLVNFLTFQLGVYLLYRLAKKWMSKPAAVAAAALFAWQPLLWGHSFINPKDPPFLVFFLGAMCLGFEMVDSIAENKKDKTIKLLLSAFFLGIATSIRVLGPLAGVLVGMYALSKFKKDTALIFIRYLVMYAVITILAAFIVWPYLWTSPLQKFIEVFGFMSDNPTQLKVLFNGTIYTADGLPRRYLPVLLAFTLTEPVWLLFICGLILAAWKSVRQQRLALFLVLLWFVIPASYVILRKPPMYDGFRHFLFMLPPLFLFTGFAFDAILKAFRNRWGSALLILILLAPGLRSAWQLHPYEYAYYNSFTGGTSGAFRTFETEFWLTCYREAVLEFDQKAPQGSQLFIRREPYIAAYYASPDIAIRDYRTEFSQIQTGDFVLVNTRTNEDRSTFHDAPVFISVQRGKAVFCEVKQIP